MSLFSRGLNAAQWKGLEAQRDAPGPNWFTDLLKLWKPSGEAAGPDGLRLAIRNGYLNFYRRGQSIAEIGFGQVRAGRQHPWMKISARYVEDRQVDPTYRKFGIGHEAYGGMDYLSQWIVNSAYKHGAEKWGVDEVVGNNAGVIDLEMGIPGEALRVDIVALEPSAEGPRLVLWEAKPLDAPALRSRAAKAGIYKQMQAYKEFIADHPGVIESAYKVHCAALVRLAEWAGKSACLSPLVAQAQSSLTVDPAVGLVLFKGVYALPCGQRELRAYPSGWEKHRAALGDIRLREAEDPAEVVLYEGP